MPWSLLLLLVLLAPTAVHTQDFVFAQSTPLTGDLGLVGQQLSIGIRAAFEQTNLNGGVEGKLLRLYTLDDGYEPTQTVNNTIQFLSNNTVFGLIGYYGSATTTASLPYILNTSTPLIGPVTGSMLVRSPFIKQVLNIRPSYADETAVIVNYLVNTIKCRRIAILYQNDLFGTSGYASLTSALATIGMTIVSSGTVERNADEFESALVSISTGNPESVVMFASATTCGLFVRAVNTNSTLYPNGKSISFAAVSSVALQLFIDTMGEYANNVIVTQVVPPLSLTSYKIVRDYLYYHALIDTSIATNAISLEGYIMGRIAVEGLEHSTNRTMFADTFYSQTVQYEGGLTVGPYSQCSADDQKYNVNSDTCACNQGLRNVWVLSIQNGTYTNIDSAAYSWQGTCYVNYQKFILAPILFGLMAPYDTGSKQDTTAGIRAAFLEFNQRGGYNGRQLQLQSLYYASADTSTYDPVLNQLLNDTLVGLVGVTDTQFIEAILGSVKKSNVPFIGAVAGSSVLYNYYPSIINVRPSYMDEIVAIIQYLINSRVLTRIACAYQNIPGGLDMFSSYTMAMNAVRLNSTGSFLMNSTSDIPRVCWELSKLPVEAVIVATRNHVFASQLMNCLHERQSTAVLVTLSIVDGNRLADALNSTSNVLLSQVVPSITDTSIAAVPTFLSSFNTSYPNRQATSTAFYGYIVGKLVTQVLSTMLDAKATTITASAFLSQLYSLKTFSLGGVTLGPYGNTCTNNTYSTNCCNNGGRTVYMTALESTGKLRPIEKIPFSQCVLDPTTITRPLVFGRSINANNDTFEQGISSAFEAVNNAGGVKSRYLKLKTMNNGGNTTLMVQQLQTNNKQLQYVDNVVGFVGLDRSNDDSIVQLATKNNMLFIGTRSGSLALRSPYNKNIINVRSSTTDQAAAIANMFYNDLQYTNVLVIYQQNSSYWEEAKSGYVRYVTSIIRAIPPHVATTTNYATFITESKPSAIVVFADAAVAQLIDTSIPIATVYDEQVLGKNRYMAQPLPTLVSDTGYNEGQVVGQLIATAYARSVNTSMASFIDQLYTESVYSINGMRLGPIGADCSLNPCAATDSCGCNQLSRQVQIIGTESHSFPFSTCGVTFPNSSSTISTPIIVIIVLIAVLVVAIIILVIIVIWWIRRVRSSTKNAPKTGNMVLCFTDVQNSTKLWQALGDNMGKALKVHNTVMRRLIKKYDGYEVKTQGDSFMICFESPTKAVEWALHAQKDLVTADWDNSLVHNFDCRMEWDEDERVLFKGLRVRMGLHYGMAERVYDQVTKRYDYFGNTVNCAARVESIAKGGQVFISQPLFDAVKENLKLVDILQFSLSHDEAVTLEPKDILIGTTPVTPKDEFSEKILYRCEGSFQLKGIEEDVTVYEVMGDTLYKRSYDTPKKSTQSSRKSSISTSEQLVHETLPQSFSPKHVSFIEEQQPSSPEQIHVEE